MAPVVLPYHSFLNPFTFALWSVNHSLSNPSWQGAGQPFRRCMNGAEGNVSICISSSVALL